MEMDFNKARFTRQQFVLHRPCSFANGEVKDFENIPGMDAYGRAKL
jgi:hypothetical protein